MQKIIWIIPFIAFLGGYIASTFFLSQGTLKTPVIVGLTVQEAVTFLSSNNINLRVVQEKEVVDLPAGTILSQTPASGNPIKQYQSIFVMISKKPPTKHVPSIVNKSKIEIQKFLKQENILAQFYSLSYPYPENSCIGTWPPANAMIDEKMIVYISDGLHKPVIIPSFEGMALKEVCEFLNEHMVKWHIIHEHSDNLHSLDNCIVIHQRPLSGSIVHLNQSCIMYLYCSPE